VQALRLKENTHIPSPHLAVTMVTKGLTDSLRSLAEQSLKELDLTIGEES